MRINNNVMAMNTHRQLVSITWQGKVAGEALIGPQGSTGPGTMQQGWLSVREDERANSWFETSYSERSRWHFSIQTAEGALNETHAILQRMRELATQASTDTIH